MGVELQLAVVRHSPAHRKMVCQSESEHQVRRAARREPRRLFFRPPGGARRPEEVLHERQEALGSRLLCVQIRALDARVLPIYGGQSIQQQLRALRRGVDVVVADLRAKGVKV